MNCFLVELEKEYELFSATRGEIIKLFQFPDDIIECFTYFFIKANTFYYKTCKEGNKKVNDYEQMVIEKDKSGKCYLKILGNDSRTILIIRRNDSNFDDYKDIMGYKITEEEFKTVLDSKQKAKAEIELAKLPKRFLDKNSEAIDNIINNTPIDICEEMAIYTLFDYYHYINNYLSLSDAVISFNEPQNINSAVRRLGNGTAPRKNEVIDYTQRRNELLKRSPKKIISCSGNKTNSILEAFLYENEGFILAVIEPKSGMGYQYDLNLGKIDINNMKLIEEMIKAALEATEDIVMMDPAIMRKNHTTIEAFSENLDIFLANAKSNKPFYYKVAAAKSVYGK